jgi:hypothetical protein
MTKRQYFVAGFMSALGGLCALPLAIVIWTTGGAVLKMLLSAFGS